MASFKLCTSKVFGYKAGREGKLNRMNIYIYVYNKRKENFSIFFVDRSFLADASTRNSLVRNANIPSFLATSL